jgi:hypothetical protein
MFQTQNTIFLCLQSKSLHTPQSIATIFIYWDFVINSKFDEKGFFGVNFDLHRCNYIGKIYCRLASIVLVISVSTAVCAVSTETSHDNHCITITAGLFRSQNVAILCSFKRAKYTTIYFSNRGILWIYDAKITSNHLYCIKNGAKCRENGQILSNVPRLQYWLGWGGDMFFPRRDHLLFGAIDENIIICSNLL